MRIPYLGAFAYSREKHLLASSRLSIRRSAPTKRILVKFCIKYKAWSGPEGSGKFRFPDFMTTAQDDGKVVSLTHRPPLPPGNAPGTVKG